MTLYDPDLNITSFMGKPLRYWLELQRQSRNMNYDGLIDEIVDLRAKIDKARAILSPLNKD